MMQPFVYSTGIIFDGRSVVLSLCALFFGPIAGVLSGLLALSYRLYIGGSGVHMGLSVIFASVLIGIAFYYQVKTQKIKINNYILYAFGLIVHTAMIILMSFLPSSIIGPVLKQISVSIIVFYPLATILIGKILLDQRDNSILINDLKQRDKNYKLITDNSADVIWMMDLDLKLLFYSPSVQKVYGYSQDEFKEKNLRDLVSESYHSEMLSLRDKLTQKNEINELEPNEIFNFESKHITKDGRLIDIEARFSFINNEYNQPITIVGVSRDVTAMKKAEIALLESEQKYKFLTENNNDFVIRLDANFHFIYANSSYLKLLGLSEKMILGKHFADFAIDLEKNTITKLLGKLVFAPYIVSFEQKLFHQNKWIHISWQNKAILNLAGGIESILCAGRDISSRIQIENDLKDSRARLRTLVDTIPFLFSTVNKEYIFTFQNSPASEFFGNLMGKTIDYLVANNNTKQKWIQEIDLALSGEYTTDKETIHRGGETFTFEKIVKPIITGYEITSVLIIMIDISDRVALHETEEKYKRLLDNIGQDYFLYQENLFNKFVFLTPSVFNVLGYRPEELINKNNYAGIISDNPINNSMLKNINRTYSGEVIKPYTVEVMHKDGTPRLLELTESSMRDFDGKIIAIDGIAKDITEQMRAEEAIKHQVLALTKPISSTENLKFTDLFNLEEIQVIQDIFSETLSISSIITDSNNVPQTKQSNITSDCRKFLKNKKDKSITLVKSTDLPSTDELKLMKDNLCLSDLLWDAGAEIKVGGNLIGNWLIGQVVTEKTDFEILYNYAHQLGWDEKIVKEYLNFLPRMSHIHFEKIAIMFSAVANEFSLKAYQNIQQARLIADINRANESVARSELSFKTLFNSNSVYMAITTLAEGKIVNINDTFLQALGYNKDEVLGERNAYFNIWDNAEDRKKVVEELTKKGNIRNFEIKLRNKDNSVRTVLYSADLVNLEIGECILSVMADITERKSAENKILNLNNELEIEVARRTEELNDALSQLQMSNLELQTLNSQMLSDAANILQLNDELTTALASKDKFFSIIAHDLRNPFVALINNSEMLLNYYDKIDENKKKEMISRMKDASQNTYSLLENLLQWSRSQMGRIEVRPIYINIYELIFKTTHLLSSQASIKNISLLINVPDDTFVLADSEMVLTVLRNLVSNAIKYSDQNSNIEIGLSDKVIMGKMKESVTKNPVSNKKPYLVFYVKDFGRGIDESNISKLFKIDEDFSLSGTLGEKGTGLGLLICKEFIESHGGKIWVESRLGIGSTFFFSLPMN